MNKKITHLSDRIINIIELLTVDTGRTDLLNVGCLIDHK